MQRRLVEIGIDGRAGDAERQQREKQRQEGRLAAPRADMPEACKADPGQQHGKPRHGGGKAGKGQLEKFAGEYGITVAISEVYDKQATDLTDILTKLKGQQIEAVVNWSIVPAQSLVAKNMKQIGLDVPLFQSHGFGNIKYAEAGGEPVNGTLLPCGRILIAEALPDDHPQKKVLMEYKQDYESRFKENASTFGGHPYDALLILTEAIKKAGSTDREKVRDAIESLTGVVGTAGIFNFSPEDHNGLTMEAFEMLTVKDGRFAIAEK